MSLLTHHEQEQQPPVLEFSQLLGPIEKCLGDRCRANIDDECPYCRRHDYQHKKDDLGEK